MREGPPGPLRADLVTDVVAQLARAEAGLPTGANWPTAGAIVVGTASAAASTSQEPSEQVF